MAWDTWTLLYSVQQGLRRWPKSGEGPDDAAAVFLGNSFMISIMKLGEYLLNVRNNSVAK